MEIKREILETLKEWKQRDNRKPILLKGARQIGKSWVLEKFGQECFDYYVKFDFDRQRELKDIFANTKEPERLLNELALFTDVPIMPDKTLIIFDEIQECEAALNSLKYFYEDAPQYHIVAAGSLLGVAVRKKKMTVPVGKVHIIKMYPISFREFIHASDDKIANYIDSLSHLDHLPEVVLNRLNEEYRRYMVCGGMPEATVALLENKGMGEVDSILQDILDLYELDFSKYAEPKEIPRIHAVWHSLPAQLAKENRKFIYKVIRSGARAKDYEDALMWLEDAGMIYRVYDVSKPGIPLSAYQEFNSFKVYASDCGLLRRLADLPSTAILSPTAGFVEFKGALAENAVLQCMLPFMDSTLFTYWTSSGTAEVEFLVQWHLDVIPIEVKASGNISGNSLAVYYKKYNPPYRVRFSSLNLQYNGGLLSAPAPLAGWFPSLYSLMNE